MTRTGKKVAAVAAAWVLGITALHLVLNVNWSILYNDRLPEVGSPGTELEFAL